ncbi:MAG TPA: diguanylate cyclase, partial [Croceibacterium sp.]|nr:diguanylate cyclase [Croceibacterium sp.]
MTDSHSELPQLPLKLPLLALIGIRDPEQGSWAALRAIQYAQIHRLSRSRALAHVMSAFVTVGLFFGKVPALALAPWVLGLAAALWNSLRIDRALADIHHRSMTRHEFRRQALGVAGVAAVWAIALLAFTHWGTMADHFALWTLLAMLIAGSAFALAPAPMATIAFSGVTGLAAMVSFLLKGELTFAVVVSAFVVMSIAGALNIARTYLAAEIAEAGVAEKSEVVSLLLREYADNAADWLWQVDTNRRIRSASPRFAYALGREMDAIEGESFIKLIAGEAWEKGQFAPSLHDLAERLKQRESFSNLLVQVEVGGARRWWEISGTPMRGEKGEFIGFRGVGSDVTHERESNEKIAYLARYDTLTGLPNRLMVTESLKDALKYAEQWRTRCAFLMIDLDRFKAVNDSLGHQIGDLMLAQVSHRLEELASDNEMCGRLGGDEFAVVIRDASNRNAVAAFADKIIKALSQPYDVENHKLYIGASVGSAMGPRDGTTVEALMR